METELSEEFDLMNNKKLVFRLNTFAIILCIFILFIGSILLEEVELSFHLSSFFLFLAVYFIIMIIHELIHGLVFKLFKPNSKIKYGFKNGMAYATNPGIIYTKKQFLIICIMPFVVISFLLFVLPSFGINKIALFLLFAMHTAGCIGDFYYCFLLLKRKEEIFIEDTEVGFNIYVKKP